MTGTDWRRLLFGLVVIGWGASVVAVYSIVHKPFSGAEVFALAEPAKTLLGLAVTIIVAHGLGRLLKPLFPSLPARPLFAFQIGFGLALLGLAMLVLGALNGYWSWVVWPLAAAGVVFNMRTFWADLVTLRPHWPDTWAKRLLALFVGLTALSVFLYALTPPTAWDALVYHLTGPKLYIQAHHINHDLDLAYLGFPQWGSMLFTWGLLLSGPLLAQLIHATFMVLTLALLPALVNVVTPGRGWLAGSLLVAVPTAVLLAGEAYVEWLTMFGGLTAFLCLLYSQDEAAKNTGSKKGPIILAGAATGLALAAKYNSAGLVVGLAVWAVLLLRWPRLIGWYILGGIIALGPYLLKNLILTGNPVYPFFLPGKYWDSFRAYWYGRPGTGLPLSSVLMAPWDMMAWGVEGATLEGKVSYNATVGPLLLIFIPLAWLAWRDRTRQAQTAIKGLVVVCAIAYVAWSVQLLFSDLLVQSRLLFPILPLAVALAVVGYDGLAALNTKSLRVQFVMGALLAISLGMTGLGYGLQFFKASPLPVIFGWQSKSDYLVSKLGAYELAVQDINKLPVGSKTLFLWEPRSYECEDTAPCDPDVLLDRWWHLRRLGLSNDAIVAQWHAAGVTHVLVFEQGRKSVEDVGFDPLTADDWAALKSLRETQLTLLHDYYGGYQLYALK